MHWTELLKAQLEAKLPGEPAQFRMAPPHRKPMKAPADARLGGVLILLFEHGPSRETILIRRTVDGQVHSGQISFPGGKMERYDQDIQATALRECEEEIGVHRGLIEVIGSLSPVYIPPSNFLVTPTIGFITRVPLLKPSAREVDEIIRLPLNRLFDPSAKQEMEVKPSEARSLPLITPVYRPAEQVIIWGATAMMLSELEHVMRGLEESDNK